jgi:hypothetical protein
MTDVASVERGVSLLWLVAGWLVGWLGVGGWWLVVPNVLTQDRIPI